MTVGTAWPYDSAAYDEVRLPPDVRPQRLFAGVALACVVASCAYTFCANPGGTAAVEFALADRGDKLDFPAGRADRLETAQPPALTDSAIAAVSFDSRFAAAFPPGAFLGDDSFAAEEQTTSPSVAAPQLASVPLGRQLARREPGAALRILPWRSRRLGVRPPPDLELQAASADRPSEQPSLFERIFGRSRASIFEMLYGPSPAKVALAYATTDGGVANDGANVAAPLYDRQTAVYDISSHTVYLPDGTTLEAHSGLGSRLDDPSSAAVRDRGVTPPDIYDLALRQGLFHGVQALRLLPEDESKVFGRRGLLAHTYMLGPNGQSNGCVSFKDYKKFLEAYEDHEITRLAVVARID